MELHGELITLLPYTKERCHELHKQYIADPLMTEIPYVYEETKVNTYYQQRVLDSKRCYFAIVYHNKTIGEIKLKDIDIVNKSGVLSIVLANDTVKNKGYGTEAERLIIHYAFEQLGLQTIYADAVKRNIRSKYVLEKVGFVHTHDDDNMSYYVCKKSEWII